MTWIYTDDQSAPCPYCVQWRCPICGDGICDDMMEHCTMMVPYWADGTIAAMVRRDACDPCVKAIEQYEEDHQNEIGEHW